jgi:hypothetical protein
MKVNIQGLKLKEGAEKNFIKFLSARLKVLAVDTTISEKLVFSPADTKVLVVSKNAKIGRVRLRALQALSNKLFILVIDDEQKFNQAISLRDFGKLNYHLEDANNQRLHLDPLDKTSSPQMKIQYREIAEP